MSDWELVEDGVPVCWRLAPNEEMYVVPDKHRLFFEMSAGMSLDRSEVADLYQLLGYWLEHGELPSEMEGSGDG